MKVQVEPAAEMTVVFAAEPRHLARIDPSLWCGLGLFALLVVCGALANWMRRAWRILHVWLQKAPVPAGSVQPAGPVGPDEPSRSKGPDQADGRVSAEELL